MKLTNNNKQQALVSQKLLKFIISNNRNLIKILKGKDRLI